MTLARGVAAVVCGRWTKWLVLAAWLVVLAVLGPLAGKLTGAESNDNSAWLPGSAESTTVLKLQRSFQTRDTAPAVVVYERASGITPDDMAKAADDAKAFAGTPGVDEKVIGPVPSADGKAIETIVPITIGSGVWNGMADTVQHLRTVLGSGHDGSSAMSGFSAEITTV